MEYSRWYNQSDVDGHTEISFEKEKNCREKISVKM